MNRRNLFLLAMVWAAVILALLLVSGADKTWLAGVIYAPAIIVAVMLSHEHGHVPDAGGIWTGAIAWSLLYWALVLVIYAILLEIWLVRAEAKRFLDHERALAADAGAGDHLAAFGAVLGSLEHRRRAHWLLAAMPGLDLDLTPDQLARYALSHNAKHRAVRGLLARLQGELARRHGAAHAAAAIAKLHDSTAAPAA